MCFTNTRQILINNQTSDNREKAYFDVSRIIIESFSDTLALSYDNTNSSVMDKLNTIEGDPNGEMAHFSLSNENTVCKCVLNPNAKCFISNSQENANESINTINASNFCHTVISDTHPGHNEPSLLEINDAAVKPVTNSPIIMSNLNPNANCFTPELSEVACELFMNISKSGYPINNNNSDTLNITNNCSNLGVKQNSTLKELRLKNLHRIIIGHLNVNSIRNKFDTVFDLIQGKIDIFLISETKIDNTFPTSQFKMSGFTRPYRLDRSESAGGLLLYVREDIPSKLLEPNFHSDIECIAIEFSIYKRKWLLLGLYNPKKSLIRNCIAKVSKYLDQYSTFYDNIILLGDFNSEMSDESMDEFSRVYGLKNLIKKRTYML